MMIQYIGFYMLVKVKLLLTILMIRIFDKAVEVEIN